MSDENGIAVVRPRRKNLNHKAECRHCHRFLQVACRGVCCTCWRKGHAVNYPPGKRGRKPDQQKQEEALERKADEWVAVLRRAEQVAIEIADDDEAGSWDSVQEALCALMGALHDELFDAKMCEKIYLPRQPRPIRTQTAAL